MTPRRGTPSAGVRREPVRRAGGKRLVDRIDMLIDLFVGGEVTAGQGVDQVIPCPGERL
jgi:hypothetical protein